MPYGIFISGAKNKRVGVALGNSVIDLAVLFHEGYFKNLPFTLEDFVSDYLNNFMMKGKQACGLLRKRLYEIFQAGSSEQINDESLLKKVLIPLHEVVMQLPVKVGDYTDFYSSREHATNVGVHPFRVDVLSASVPRVSVSWFSQASRSSRLPAECPAGSRSGGPGHRR